MNHAIQIELRDLNWINNNQKNPKKEGIPDTTNFWKIRFSSDNAYFHENLPDI